MKRVILLSLSILLISLGYSFADVPCKINYQGRLIEDNVPVDGTKTMVFSIYNSAVGGTQLWTSGNVGITVYNGLFRYVLGEGFIDGSPVDDLSGINWTAGQELYLQVIVDGETLTPLEAIYAYPYAINSHLLEGATKEYFLNISGDTQTKRGDLNIMGNVGIGTTGPTHKLDVRGPLRIDQGASYDVWIQGGSATSGATRNLALLGIKSSDELRLNFDGEYTGGVRIQGTKTIIDGNVGIGTTNPGEKLTVTGTIESTTGGVKFPDGSVQTTAAVFGSWTDKDSKGDTLTKNKIYQATSDGYVTVYKTTEGYITGYTPSNILRMYNVTYGSGWGAKASISMPVRKNDTWKITEWTLAGFSDSSKIYWLPIGNGQCIEQ